MVDHNTQVQVDSMSAQRTVIGMREVLHTHQRNRLCSSPHDRRWIPFQPFLEVTSQEEEGL
jgi:hypothetical protein